MEKKIAKELLLDETLYTEVAITSKDEDYVNFTVNGVSYYAKASKTGYKKGTIRRDFT